MKSMRYKIEVISLKNKLESVSCHSFSCEFNINHISKIHKQNQAVKPNK